MIFISNTHAAKAQTVARNISLPIIQVQTVGTSLNVKNVSCAYELTVAITNQSFHTYVLDVVSLVEIRKILKTTTIPYFLVRMISFSNSIGNSLIG